MSTGSTVTVPTKPKQVLSFTFTEKDSTTSAKSTSSTIKLSTPFKQGTVISGLRWDTGAAPTVDFKGPCFVYPGPEPSGGFVHGGGDGPSVYPGDTCVFTVTAPETAARSATSAEIVLTATAYYQLSWTAEPLGGCFPETALPVVKIVISSGDALTGVAKFSLQITEGQDILEPKVEGGRTWTFTLLKPASNATVTAKITFAASGNWIVDTTKEVEAKWKIGGC